MDERLRKLRLEVWKEATAAEMYEKEKKRKK